MDKKKQFGQYFTPEIIAKFMVSFITKEKDALILEPSAGKVIFLIHI
jgi:type I restriction-modification system DNA methylase subunit